MFQRFGIGDGRRRKPFNLELSGGAFTQIFMPSLEPALSQAVPGFNVFVPMRAAIKSGGPAKTGMFR